MSPKTKSTSLLDAPGSLKVPAWLENLDEVRSKYLKSGAVPDDIDEAWVDRMIARIKPLAKKERYKF